MNYLDNEKLILLAQAQKDKEDEQVMRPLFSLPISNNPLENKNDIISLPDNIEDNVSLNTVSIPSLQEKWKSYKEKMEEASTKNPQPIKEDDITEPGKAPKSAPSMSVKKAPAVGISAHEKPEEQLEEPSMEVLPKNIASSDTFNKILESRDRAQFLNQMARIGAQTTYAMMGKESPFEKQFESQQEMIEKGPQKYLQQVEFQKQDPNSSISKQYQAVAAKMGYAKETTGSSAADIEKMFPQLTNMFTAREAQKARHEDLAFKYALLNKEKEDKKQIQLSDKQNKAIENYAKIADKHYSEYATLKQAVDSIDVNKIGSSTGPSDMAAIYNFVKILDPASVVREGELALAKSGMSFPQKFRTALKSKIYGGLIDKQFRKEMAVIAKYLADKGAQKYHSRLKTQRNILKNRYNLTDEDISQYDPVLLEEAEEKKLTDSQISPKTQELINSRSEEENQKRLLELRQKHKR